MRRPSALARRTAAVSTVAAVAAVTLAACGSSSGGSGAGATAKLAPKDAVLTGVRSIESGNAATFTISLDATTAQLQALETADGKAAGGSGATAVTVLHGGSIVLAVRTSGASFAAEKADPKALSKESFGVTVNAGDQPQLVQVAEIGGQLYARAAVAHIAGYVGASGTRELQQFSSGTITTKYPFLAKAIAGDWIKIDLNEVLDLVKGAVPGGIPSTSPQQGQQLLSALGGVFTKDVTVTRAAADPALGDHLVLTGNSGTIAQDALTALKSSLSAVPDSAQLFAKLGTGGVPARNVTVDAYVNGGTLDALKLNLTQFLPAAEVQAVKGAPIDVVIRIGKTASIAAPATSTTVTPGQILGLVESLSAGSAGVSGL